MHEWALAQAVVLAARDIAKKSGIKEVRRVEVLMGELQTIDDEVFSFALDNIKKEMGMNSAKFKLKVEPARMECKSCGHSFLFKDSIAGLTDDEVEMIHFLPDISKTFMSCPKCKSPDYGIVEGRGVSIAKVE